MKVWILVLIAVLLFFWTSRESFNPAAERPSATDESLKTAVRSIVGANANVDKYIQVIQKYYDDKYIPDKQSPTPTVISSFIGGLPSDPDVDKTRLPQLIDYVFLSVEALDEVDYTCPEGFVRKDGTCKDKETSTQTATPICPLTYDFQESTKKCRRQGARGGTATTGTTSATTGTSNDIEPTCPSGFTMKDGLCTAPLTGTTCPANSRQEGNECIHTEPTCPSGYTLVATSRDDKVIQVCRINAAETVAVTIGGRTTTSEPGGFGLPGRNVWGPIFGGFGESSGWASPDSTSSNTYPELIGGGLGGGAGAAGGGAAGKLGSWDFTLPGAKSLGTEENARFLPFSRQPGDMDVIQDPWRVSQTFTSSSYSSKTDPVPFLNDFSAFQK